MTASPRAVPLYVGGAALSLFGNSAISIVLPWLVLTTTGSLSSAGLIAAVSAVASVPATFTAGRLIDRVGGRNVAVLADLGSAASVLGLIVVDATVGLSIPWFMVLGVAGAVFDVPGMTARQSMMAGVSTVSGTSVDKIAGLYQSGFSLALLGGPALAGVLLGVLDPIEVVWLTAACSAGAAAATALVPVQGRAANPGPSLSGGALAVIRRSPALRTMVIIAFTTSLITPPIISLLLPGHFNRIDEPDQLGLCMSAFAIGLLGASLLYARIAQASRRTAYVTAIVALTIGRWLIAPLDEFWMIAAGMLAMGAGAGLFGPIWNVYVATRVPDAVRGRVLSLMMVLGLVAGPLGLGLMALILRGGDLRLGGLLVAGCWTLIAAYAILSPGARTLTESEPEPVAQSG
ncbi:MFS transporter [Aeromicrobium sp. Root236]|uniref:MFS transporter n=1 Tax=Aeromicrobium sp. Root236 TaxID=1736498 RepID=UPI0009EC8735|nr:MFS transporter [Aeromicrobium sp. Root236]